MSLTLVYADYGSDNAKQTPVENKTATLPTNSQPTPTTSQTESVQEKILQQLTSLHFKIGNFSLDISKKLIVTYSIIAVIPFIIILVIASTVRSKKKNKKQNRK